MLKVFTKILKAKVQRQKLKVVANAESFTTGQ